jgi:hypothetical protein
MTLLIGFHGPR